MNVLNQKYPNKSAFITGAGSGLGAAFTTLLAKNGWTLHLSDINYDSLEQLKPTLENAADIFLYKLDIGNKLEFEKVVEELQKQNA